MRLRFQLISAALMLSAGCQSPSEVMCPGVVSRAVEVDVVDARTGAWAAAGASGEVQDGAFVEALQPVGWRGTPPNDTATTLGAALGRAGTYTVRLTKPGYAPYERADVRARAGRCGVETARLTARLTPAP
jgi:hypothetical protein